MQSSVMRRAAFGLAITLFFAFATACGGGDSNDSGNKDVTARPTEPIAASPTKFLTQPSSITLVAKDVLFDADRLKASPGALTIEFDNRDGGVPHNLHVYRGADASGDSVGQTELESGPVKQTLELDLGAGEYFYVCDAHPTTMAGMLEVG